VTFLLSWIHCQQKAISIEHEYPGLSSGLDKEQLNSYLVNDYQEAQLTLWVADRIAPSHTSTITRYVFEGRRGR